MIQQVTTGRGVAGQSAAAALLGQLAFAHIAGLLAVCVTALTHVPSAAGETGKGQLQLVKGQLQLSSLGLGLSISAVACLLCFFRWCALVCCIYYTTFARLLIICRCYTLSQLMLQ
jgi:hypothetical protein